MTAERDFLTIAAQREYIRDLRDICWAVAKAVETKDRDLWDMALELCRANSSTVTAP